MKYIIRARADIKGKVEEGDIIGAIFGQTEGLLGPDLDIKRLYEEGKIGRIKVGISYRERETNAELAVPSTLSMPETALIAAALETVDRIGPYEAKIQVEGIVDIREEKRKYIRERAKKLVEEHVRSMRTQCREMIDFITKAFKPPRMKKYKGLPAGPDVDVAKEIIVVEGSADVRNLLECGYKNVIAVEGLREEGLRVVSELSKQKDIIAFVDGDRGGIDILKKLLERANVKYVARAPPGKEVENLTRLEIEEALKKRIPAEEAKKRLEEKPPFPEKLVRCVERMRGTWEAVFLDENLDEVGKVAVSQLAETLKGDVKGCKVLVLDGLVTQRIVDVAAEKGIKMIIGFRLAINKHPASIRVLTYGDVLRMT